ncbi:Aldo/keto reductase [Pholiota conissans]|uniref:Aldo/keto reductase n=1 Tax=Pholiota conissans TaxID=109636 RepID=A0A9P6D7X9_9AGAR|nr:Aldo/keto reductase [Pholiota conissans]
MFVQTPAQQSKLGRYRLLSPTSSVHVSPLQLGAMSIGDKWHDMGMGSTDKESSFKLLGAYYDNGGNFIDTANFYQDETSEMFIGEWAEKRGIRDQLFIATKYSTNLKNRNKDVKQQILYAGNGAKSMYLSLKASLKKLRTSYIDLYYVHWWDWNTSIEEMMRSLHALIMERKVLYLGIADTPAWVVTKANQYARDHALTPFSVYQGAWNVMDRSFEREIIPMARHEGMALAVWNVLAGGKIRTDEEEERRRKTGENGRTLLDPKWERNEHQKLVCKALEKVAAEIGAKSITSVAIAYILHKTTHVFPILGGRKVEHLLANLESLDLSLTPEHIKYIENVTVFDPGFPHWVCGDGTSTNYMMSVAGDIDSLPMRKPINVIDP